RNQYRRHAPVRPHRRRLGLPAVPQGAGLSTRHPDCSLCQQDGGKLLWRGSHLRVIQVDDPDYPGFTREVWNAHIAEMTSLPTPGRELLMRAVWAVEKAQRDVLQSRSVHREALGNTVPHLHWHVTPRWRDDRHFPDAIWAAP